jgi:putative ABC transport system ATP-binding protein
MVQFLRQLLSPGKAASGGSAEPHLDTPPSLIDVRTVRKTFKTAAGDFQALKGVNLKIQQGEFVGIVGKSGSGKSTLMNMITGIDRPSAGDVYVNQAHLNNMSEAKMAKWRGVNIGVIFQFFQLLPTLTVVENVMLPMDFCNKYTVKERRERALHLLEIVDIAHQAEKLPMMISGGQQQRVAIARALANDAPLIIADEPTGNLDSKTADQVFHFFDSLVKGDKTFVMVTHDHDMAGALGRVVTIADGEIVADTGSQSSQSSLLPAAGATQQRQAPLPVAPRLAQLEPAVAVSS